MRTPSPRRATGRAGFTLVELLVGLTLLGLMLTLGLPALQQLIQRSKLQAVAREMAVTMQAARFEAIKRSRPTVFRFDTADEWTTSFVDEDEAGVPGVLDEGETELTYSQLPTGIAFAAPGGEAVVDGLPMDGDEAWVVFNPDGSCEVAGALRLGDGRGDFLEVRLALTATARVEINQWKSAKWTDL